MDGDRLKGGDWMRWRLMKLGGWRRGSYSEWEDPSGSAALAYAEELVRRGRKAGYEGGYQLLLKAPGRRWSLYLVFERATERR